jgi:ABC-type multidrug transport system fused ATPase/permease subunit
VENTTVAESASSEFRRFASGRVWLQPAMLPGLAAMIAASACLALAMLCGTGIAWLLVQVANDTTSGPDRGLLPLLESATKPPCSWCAAPLQRIVWFQSTGSAAITLLMTGCVALVLRGVLQITGAGILERNIARSVLRLRQHIHRKALRLEPADLTGEQSATTNRLFQQSAETLENSAAAWNQLWTRSGLDIAICLIIPLMLNWRVALQVLIPFVLGRMFLLWEARRADASTRLLADQVTRSLGRMAESLNKPRIVTSFGMEQSEQQELELRLNEWRARCQTLRRQQHLAEGVRRLARLAMTGVPAALLIAQCVRGMHPASALLIAGCAFLLDRRLTQASGLPALTSIGSQAAEEIADYINRVPSVSQAPGARFQEPLSRALTFDQVSWQCPQRPNLLKGLDLRIPLGERVALLSLDSTAANAVASMIPRFIDPDFGQVLIDGRDIREATLESLRAEAIFVSGDDAVFNASVLENITCGHSDISRQQALEAAKLVHADHFIRHLPQGYETVLGEHGQTLDAGQAFRLSLARAIVRTPALLVIEEPAAPLDPETKTMLDDTYQRIGGDRTLIFLPSRLSTVKRCSRIVLIHEGRVAVDGTYEQLVRTNELYRHWEYMRFNPYRDETE